MRARAVEALLCLAVVFLVATGARGEEGGLPGGVNFLPSHAPVTAFEVAALESVGTDGWSFTLVMHLNSSVVFPSDPPTQCNPEVAPPAIAVDGLPYFTHRAHYVKLPQNVIDKTGFKTVEIDWNPCGHPPAGIWTIPHYDAHFYYIDFETLMNITCGGTTVCPPHIPENSRFFNFPSDNANLVVDYQPDGVGVEKMGMHWFKPPTDFANVAHVMGSFDGAVTYFELMSPPHISHGEADGLTYINQTMMNLPTAWVYDMAHDHSGAVDNMTITLSKSASPASSDDPTPPPSSNGSAPSTVGFGSWIVMAVLSVIVLLAYH